MDGINKIILGVFSGLGIALIVAMIWLGFANAHLRTELAQAQAGAASYRTANDTFRQQAQKQNQAIEALRTETEQRAQKAAVANKAAQKKAARYTADVARLQKMVRSGDDCQSADALMRHFMLGMK